MHIHRRAARTGLREIIRSELTLMRRAIATFGELGMNEDEFVWSVHKTIMFCVYNPNCSCAHSYTLAKKSCSISFYAAAALSCMSV